MNDILFKAISGQINVDEAQGIVECFVSGVGNKDSVGDIVLPGAFEASLRRRKPRVVWGHDWNSPIGKVLEIYEVPASDPRLPRKMKQAGIGGLFAKVQFNLQSERGRQAFADVSFFGEDQEWSIGYKTLDAVYDNERKANLLREVELYEVSPVLHGANSLTGTISIKSEQQDVVDSFAKSEWKMFDRAFAERIKQDYPEIWAAGGNIKGNDQYEILTRIAEQGGSAKTPDQVDALELREAWVARHKGDFRLPGVIAQIKWLAIGSRGEDHMKRVVNEAIAKSKGKKSEWSDEDDEDMMGEKESATKKPSRKPKITDMQLYDLLEIMSSEIDKKKQYGEDYSEDEEDMWRLRRLMGRFPGGRVDDEDYEDDDDEDMMPMMRMRKPRPCPCGCDMKNDESDEKSLHAYGLEGKAGRVLSSSNMQKIMQAMDLLREVVAAGGRQDIEMKGNLLVDGEDIDAVKSAIAPVLDYYKVDSDMSQDGILIKSADFANESWYDDFSDAILNAVTHFDGHLYKFD